jgi:hypothetical protein
MTAIRAALSPVRRELGVVLAYGVLHLVLSLLQARSGAFMPSRSLTGLGVSLLTFVVLALRMYVLFAVPAIFLYRLGTFRVK